ncbi:MAG TPA: FtsQ-type POTRA domain-containing protein [Candidatus Limnocylindrales bacterium]|nr:FtsQ-type POTRA domain-containing protein [Candidatus Limnocylindrales bacterium]
MRRTKPVKRASAAVFTPVRAAASLALLVAVGGLYGSVASDAFTARTTSVRGNTWTSEEAIVAALAVPPGQNVFTLETTALEERIEQIPAVAGAEVTVALPDGVRVSVAEREALIAWAVGPHRYLVDAGGTLFGETGQEPSDDAAQLPVVTDRRLSSVALEIGSTLDPVSLDAALRLASLTPGDIGSAGRAVGVRIDDENGFVLHGEPEGWNAIFGFYTPTLRTTDLIPGQVRLLRSLMAANDESTVQRVVLADERSGTWVPRRTPHPSDSPKP